MLRISKHLRHFLIEQKYLHFFLTGVSAVGIHLLITWSLTTFVFGLQNYFKGYAIGVAITLLYNFTIHTRITFQTKGNHVRRFVFFSAYSLGMALLQASLVHTITPIVGLKYYLLVIASIIMLFSLVSFAFFKKILFRA